MQRGRHPRVVLDSNVLVSGIIGRSDWPPRQTLTALLDNRFNIVVSREILDEYRDVLHRPWIRTRLAGNDAPVRQLLWYIETSGIRVESHVPVFESLRDADDALFLAAAIAVNAEFLVTYDKHLRDIADDTQFGSFQIVTAHQFLEQIT